MSNSIYTDSEYESIRAIFKNRDGNGGKLPDKTVSFIPADRADAVLALDERIQTLRKFTPAIVGAMILFSFLAGMLV